MITYYGYVHGPKDAMLLFEACRVGMLKRVGRRLSDSERSQYVRSGSVFVWDEDESGIKRWTDGVHWSPSRINGSFLAYREVQLCRRVSPDGQTISENITKENGLIKKAISIIMPGHRKHHLVSYYTMQDLKAGQLPQPSQVQEFAQLKLSSDIYPDFTGKMDAHSEHLSDEDKHVPLLPRAPAYTLNGVQARNRRSSPASSSCSKSEKIISQREPIQVQKTKKARLTVVESKNGFLSTNNPSTSLNTHPLVTHGLTHRSLSSSPPTCPSPMSSGSSASSPASTGAKKTPCSSSALLPHTPQAAEPAMWTRFQTNEQGGIILPSLENIQSRHKPTSFPASHQGALDKPEFLAHRHWKPTFEVRLNVLESFRGLKFTRS